MFYSVGFQLGPYSVAHAVFRLKVTRFTLKAFGKIDMLYQSHWWDGIYDIVQCEFTSYLNPGYSR